MAMHDRAIDVTTAPIDVSNHVMDMVWCDPMCESRRTIASAVLDTQKTRNTAQCIGKAPLSLPNVKDQA